MNLNQTILGIYILNNEGILHGSGKVYDRIGSIRIAEVAVLLTKNGGRSDVFSYYVQAGWFRLRVDRVFFAGQEQQEEEVKAACSFHEQ